MKRHFVSDCFFCEDSKCVSAYMYVYISDVSVYVS